MLNSHCINLRNKYTFSKIKRIFHYKKSNDLEIFEVSNLSKEQLEEICDLKQPIVFNYENEKFTDLEFENICINFKARF